MILEQCLFFMMVNFLLFQTEAGVAVDDRVAFACMFLPDGKLLEYLKWLLEKLCDEGNLDGLLLTGNLDIIDIVYVLCLYLF